MIIQHNITALNAYNRLSTNNSMVSKNLEKLSSGYRINRAGDDAAGLAISEKMRAQITGLERATLNAQDGISLVQTAEGALTEVHSMLNRMVELGTQSANGTYQPEDRQKIQSEVDALLGEIDRISQATNFNGINLLDGTLGLDTKAIESQYTDAISSGGMTSTTNIKLGGAAVTAQKGTFSISTGDLAVSQNAEGTLQINFGGEDITINLSKTNAEVLTGKNGYNLKTDAAGLDADALAGKIATILTNRFGGAGNVEIGGIAVDNITATDNVISITQKALPNSSADVLDLAKMGFSLTATKTSDATTSISGDVYHGVKVLTESRAPSSASRAEADISFDVSKISNGATITLGNKTYTYFTKDSGKTAAGSGGADAVVPNNGEIDLVAYSDADLRNMDEKDLKKLIAEKTVAATTNTTWNPVNVSNWSFQVGKDGMSIHADAATAGPDIGDFTNKATIAAQFSSTTIPKNAGVSLTIDDSLVKQGMSVKIGDKLYEFTNNQDVLKNKGAIAVVINGLEDQPGTLKSGDAAKALQRVAGGSISTNDVQTISILAANKTDNSPMISGSGLTLQIGDTADGFNQVTVAVDDMGTKGLGIENLKVTDQGWSQDSIEKIKSAIEKVSVNRGNLGALQNRLEHTINNLTTTSENMTAAESRVRDTDMAKEMMDFTKNNVLVQAAQAMLAQANQQPQQVLQLLR